MEPTTPPYAVGPWRELAPGVYVAIAEPGTVNLGLVVGSEAALLVDVGSSPAHAAAVRRAVAEVTDRPLVAAVVTHGHALHSGGLAGVADLVTVGHESLFGARHLDGRVSRRVVVAAAVDLGGRRAEAVHLGRGHTAGDLVVVVPGADVVFAGDLVDSSAPPTFGPDAVAEEWAVTLDGLIGLMTAGTRTVPGHGEPVDREFVFEARGRVAAVAEEVRRLAAAGVPEAEALAAGTWPYPAEGLTDAVARGYAVARGAGTLGVDRPGLPLA